MSDPLHIDPVALDEFNRAVDWYEADRAGRGTAFSAAVYEMLDTIEAFPDRYPVVAGIVRQATLVRFPYVVYYRIDPDRVVVIAIIHGARNPKIWRGRNPP